MHLAYDCLLKQEIFFRISGHLFPADNPQQSETASHIGVNGNHDCRRDKSGGNKDEKESRDGYDALFSAGFGSSGQCAS